MQFICLFIESLVKENENLFDMDGNETAWKEYVSFVDNIVYENVLLTIGISLGYIVEQMDPINNVTPLFESRLELLDPNLIFVPSLDPNDPNGLNNLLTLLIEDIMKMSTLFISLKLDECENYHSSIVKNADITDMQHEILEGVDQVVEEAAELCNDFQRYSYLWLDDREKCMEIFLTFGRFLESDELDLIAMHDFGAPKPCQPTIEMFREQIDNYESLFGEIEKIAPFQVFNGWFQVDCRPFRHALLNIVRKWGNMFKNHLVDRVTSNLMDLAIFIRRADEQLLQQINEGDYNGLVNIMAYLLNVKERAITTDDMFEPMQQIINLLKFYDQDIPEEVNVLLQELPDQWMNTKKIATIVKQQVAPLQAIEVAAIRNKIINFDANISFFRDVFRNYEFFKYSCDAPYNLIDLMNNDIERLEFVMKDIQCSGNLFEVNVPDFKILKQCRKELKLLKVCIKTNNINSIR